MKRYKLVFLIIITLIGLILRITKLDEVPANLSRGELIFADKFGPSINYDLFWLRLPMVIINSLFIPLIILLIWKMSKSNNSFLTDAGIWTGALLTLSPWHMIFSRRAELPFWPWQELSLQNVLYRFFSFLSPKYLFLTGDSVFLLTGNSGLTLSVFAIAFLGAVVFAKRFSRFFWWTLAGVILATALASIQPHEGNSQALIPALIFWTGLLGWGMAMFMKYLLTVGKIGKTLIMAWLLIFIYQSVTSIQNVFIHANKLSQMQWELIYRPVAHFLIENQDKFELIVVTDRYNQPRKYLNWYSKGKINMEKVKFDKFRNEYAKPGVLYIGSIDERGHYLVGYQTLTEFQLPVGIKVLFAGVI